MEWDRLPGITRIARNLRTLADAPLEGAAFRAACTAFGWQPDESDFSGKDDNYLAFLLPANGRYLHVTFTEGGAVNLAVLPLLYWEDWDPEFCDSEAQYRRARAAFDRKYERALGQAERVLGPPQRAWVEEDDEDRFRKAVWQGATCLLALQQDDYDVQYGFDINFLLQPHAGPLPERPELRV